MACRFQISLSADFFDSGVTGGQIEVMSTGAVYHGEDSFCNICWVFFYHKTISKDIIYLQKKLGFKNKI
jgi:hypothetical protein